MKVLNTIQQDGSEDNSFIKASFVSNKISFVKNVNENKVVKSYRDSYGRGKRRLPLSAGVPFKGPGGGWLFNIMYIIG